MKMRVLSSGIVALVLGICVLAFGEAPTPVVPIQDWITEAIQWVFSLHGMAVGAIVVGATQLIMHLCNTFVGDLLGKWKLLVVSFVSLVGTVVGGMTGGVSLWASLLSGAGLNAIQVFVHQLWSQFFPSQS